VPIEIARSNTGLRLNIARARDSTQLFLGDGPCRCKSAACQLPARLSLSLSVCMCPAYRCRTLPDCVRLRPCATGSLVKVAHTGMEVEEVVANILAAAAGVVQRIPGKWASVQGAPQCLSATAEMSNVAWPSPVVDVENVLRCAQHYT
jgi:hypothetical protein